MPPLGSGEAPLDPVRQWVERRTAASVALYQAAAGTAEARMRSGARWRDRTALARASLHARAAVDRRGEDVRVTLALAHGVGYGRWLETVRGPLMGRRARVPLSELQRRRNQGPLAILWPAAERLAPELRDAVRRLWSRGGGA